MTLDQDICYRALRSRDRRFDGRFFTAVSSTSVYCRPVCPARTPKRSNCTFYPSAAAAEEAGYRPCLRCRPETAPGTPAWRGSSATVSRALRLISEGALDRVGVEDLADRLGVGARHLRRLFVRELGASPLSVALTRRVHFAKKLLDETDLPMGQIAVSAGFSNVRRFNAAVKQTYGRNPTAIRRRKRSQPAVDHFELKLAYRPPYDWDSLVAYLAPRATPGVEQVTDNSYRRTLAVGTARGVMEILPAADGDHLLLRLPGEFAPDLLTVVTQVRDLCDLDADPARITAQLATDEHLSYLVTARPGLRVPGTWDRFELSVRAILGQQVSVRGATTLAGRLVAIHGEPLLEAEMGESGEPDQPDRIFPGPEVLADADLTRVGLPRTRAAAIRTLATAVRDGDLVLDSPTGLSEAVAKLAALPGMGPWTAQYIAMRALREPDALPATDLGLLQACGRIYQDGKYPRKIADRATARELRDRADAWRPWRAYAAVHLWASLGDN